MGEKAEALRFIYQIVCILTLIIYLIWGVQILWGIK
jgi:succinate dehydrogenase hydrophobic anchor subunit